jgi:predicted acyl esterase
MTSLRIDFHGCGESSGDVQDITVHQQVQDAQNAFQWLAESGHCNPSRMGMVGFSLGAAVATIVATRHPGDIKSLVLLSPLANMHHDLQEKYGRECFYSGYANGYS